MFFISGNESRIPKCAGGEICKIVSMRLVGNRSLHQIIRRISSRQEKNESADTHEKNRY